jgi:hypothetical protein
VDKISENGARIHTGRGLEETKRRITEAFKKANETHGITGSVKPKQPAVQAANLSTKQSHYSQEQFIEETNAILDQAARLPLPHVTRHKEHSYYVGDLNKQPLAEDLFAAASRLARAETGSTKERRKTS